MGFTLVQINQLLLSFRYFILFPLVVIEGPIITVIAGFFISLGQLDFYLTYLLVVAGDLAGDSLYYLLGRFGKTGFLSRWGRFIGLNQERITGIERHFNDHGGKTMFIGKLSHGIGAAFLVAAGLGRMPYPKFVWYNFLATAVKSLVLIAIGYYFGHALTRIKTLLDWVAVIIIGAGLIAAAWYYFYHRPRNHDV